MKYPGTKNILRSANCSLLLFLLLFSPASRLQAGILQGSDDQELKELPLFLTDDLLELTLTFNMRSFTRDVGEESDYHPARLSYVNEQGDTVFISLKIKTRGHFRKDPSHCNFPPVRMNFSSENTSNTIFTGVDKIKLVTHCNSRRSVFEQYILKEYLAYKMYNLFTEESFRARLARITYVDSSGKTEPIEKYAFFIEPEEYLASRNDSKLIEIEKVNQERTDKEKMLVLCIFQYMIGNTDWSVPTLHNIRLLQDEPGAIPIAVPYDFDWCGLVNPPYAYPPPQLEIEYVTERLYRGFCRPEGEYHRAFQKFNDNKEAVYDLISSFHYLDPKQKKILIRYIDNFYEIINNPRAVKSEFHEKCR